MTRARDYLDYAGTMLDRVTAGLAIGRAEADAANIARHCSATLKIAKKRSIPTGRFQ
jgi:hypothetical protein